MDLSDRRIVITGGATGIGRATAMRCAAEGAKVVVADINPAEGEQCVEGIRSAGGEAWYVRVDVTTESDVEAMAAAADQHGATYRLVIELDVGMHRAGLEPGPKVIDLARRVAACPRLKFAGLMTWE